MVYHHALNFCLLSILDKRSKEDVTQTAEVRINMSGKEFQLENKADHVTDLSHQPYMGDRVSVKEETKSFDEKLCDDDGEFENAIFPICELRTVQDGESELEQAKGEEIGNFVGGDKFSNYKFLQLQKDLEQHFKTPLDWKKISAFHSSDPQTVKPFGCSLCGKRFSDSSGLRGHIRSHTGERPYACSFCPKRFTYSSNLRTHTRIHTGEKRHECSYCGKRFVQLIALKSHTFTHTGEKPFSCPHCDKRFNRMTHRRTHILIHTGEKPHKCPHCTKKFSTTSHLKRHSRIHVEEEKFVCPQCHQRFRDSTNLETHVKVHGVGEGTKEKAETSNDAT